MASPEVDWDRLDKTKVFLVGVPLFSAVTTGLYPLTVVKTRQMASHGVPGGLGGSVQTAAAIWRADGLRGFYRGFGTVIFGTIPGRTVYLTTLELTKATMQSNDALIQSMAPTALAGASNFVAGGVASLATQVVAVPVDVVSQRLMVHGADLGRAAAGGGGGGGSRPAAGAAAQQRRGFGSLGARAPLASPVLAEAQQRLQPWGERVAGGQHPQQWQQHGRAFWQQRPQPARRRAFSSGVGGSGAVTAAVAAPSPQRMNGFTMTRLIVQQEGLRGLWRGLVPSAALYVPNSAIWWGCFGGWQSLIWLTLHPEAAAADGAGAHGAAAATAAAAAAEPQPDAAGSSTGEIVAVQTAAAALAGACSAVLTTPLDVLKTRLQVSGGDLGGGSGGGARGGGAAVGGAPAAAAAPVQGASWSSILRDLLREEGARGLWRGLAPRMASSSIFGVCMTVTYMQLKRWCAIEEV